MYFVYNCRTTTVWLKKRSASTLKRHTLPKQTIGNYFNLTLSRWHNESLSHLINTTWSHPLGAIGNTLVIIELNSSFKIKDRLPCRQKANKGYNGILLSCSEEFKYNLWRILLSIFCVLKIFSFSFLLFFSSPWNHILTWLVRRAFKWQMKSFWRASKRKLNFVIVS